MSVRHRQPDASWSNSPPACIPSPSAPATPLPAPVEWVDRRNVHAWQGSRDTAAMESSMPAATPALSKARVAWPWVLAALVGACGGDRRASDGTPPDAASTPMADASTSTRPTAPAIDGDPALPPPARPLPPTRPLTVTVEGQVESRIGRLFQSPLGYAIYVLPQVEMTQEEPCCDLAFARVDDGYFMRIERITPEADTAMLRENARLSLSGVGEARDLPSGHAALSNFDATDLHMVAGNDEVAMEVLVGSVGDGRYRITLHLPLREASEGIVPTLRAMLGSLQTTGPLERTE